MNATTELVNEVEVIAISLLDDKAKLADVIAKLNEVVTKVNELEVNKSKARDRGPESTREMIEDDARRILIGDLKDMSHKAAAEALKLSYGQVYSARKGFTFKSIYKEWRDSNKA